MDVESIKAVEPDIEVVVRIGQYEIAVIGVFKNKPDVFDLVFGVDDSERVDQLQTLFSTLAAALPSASFSEVRTAGGE